MLDVPSVDPFTGEPVTTSSGGRKSRHSSKKRSTNTNRRTAIGLVNPMPNYSATAGTHLRGDFEARLMEAFRPETIGRAPTGEELAAQWCMKAGHCPPARASSEPPTSRSASGACETARKSLVETQSTASANAHGVRPKRGIAESLAPTAHKVDSLRPACHKVDSVIPAFDKASARRSAVAVLPRTACTHESSSPTGSAENHASSDRPENHEVFVQEEEEGEEQDTSNDLQTPTSCEATGFHKKEPKMKTRKFIPPSSSRARVRTLEEEEGISVSPFQALCVDDAVDRLREYFLERFGSARKAFVALQRAGCDDNKPGLRCVELMTTKDLRIAMRRLGVRWAEVAGYGNIHKILKAFDADGSGHISLEDIMGVQHDSSSDEGEDEDVEPDPEMTWKEKRALAEKKKLNALRKHPRWTIGESKKSNRIGNVVGRDMILIRHTPKRSRLEESDLPIWQRYEKMRVENAAAISEERQRRLESQLDECTFQPQIFTKQRCRSEGCLRRTHDERASPRRSLAHTQVQRVEYSFRPQTCKRSDTIYRAMREDEELWSNRLANGSSLKRVCSKPHTNNQELTFTPTLSERSRKLHQRGRHAQIHERFFRKDVPDTTMEVKFTPRLGRLLDTCDRITLKHEGSDVEVEEAGSVSEFTSSPGKSPICSGTPSSPQSPVESTANSAMPRSPQSPVESLTYQ